MSFYTYHSSALCRFAQTTSTYALVTLNKPVSRARHATASVSRPTDGFVTKVNLDNIKITVSTAHNERRARCRWIPSSRLDGLPSGNRKPILNPKKRKRSTDMFDKGPETSFSTRLFEDWHEVWKPLSIHFSSFYKITKVLSALSL